MPIRQRHVLIPFFVSGFTALVFEVVWAKQACMIFGNTTLASAAVIAAFMTGLAIGSFLFGRVADRRPDRALLFYGLLEGGIGLFALAFPLLLKALVPVYRAIYLSFYQDFFTISVIRFFMSFLVLALPTIFMGGTLPLLSRFLSGTGEAMNKNINALYAVNLLGAAAGSFASGFILIASLGLWKTTLVAASMNLGLAFYVRTVFQKNGGASGAAAASADEPPPSAQASEPEPSMLDVWLILGLMFVHGFAAFVIQICWTRTMALILGSSTYAFSAMLTTFLAGLGLGTAIVRQVARRNVRLSLAAIGFLEIAAAMSVLAFIPAFEWAVYFFVKLYPFITTFRWTLTAEFLLCAMTMIVPTALIGILFPAVLYHLGRPRDIGRIVGRTYAVNTLGGVLGAFTAAFIFIGRMGVNGSLRTASVLSFAAGAAVTLASSGARFGRNLRIMLALAFVSSFFLLYEWDRNLYSSGVFMYAEGYLQQARLGKKAMQAAFREGQKLLFYKDGVSTTVTVFSHEREPNPDKIPAKSLRVNGKVDASTIGDMSTQLYCGFLPLFARPDAQDVLIVGLGSGVTLGSVLQFDAVQSVEQVEIEPAVVEANKFFEVENHFALKDPRVKLIIGDGRNHISFTPKTYDVIISVPSNPWISGVSSLFTKENYELALKKLKPDGVYCQWFHSYQMSKADFIMIMKTFASTFPEISLYQVEADYLLLGSRKKIVFDYDRITEIAKNKSLQADLKYFGDYEALFLEGHFSASNRDFR
ncbi:MAG TPA: fused MFS/spermidine synthase, partial [Candidatus Eisenbacteria bacterium]|nr:fused MFS/spermidine synthase [Candidatus Eisenbacteria bacterium]